MDTSETFGQLIRVHRQSRGETLAELAENLLPFLPDQDTGISVAMLSRIETDDRMPSTKVASALAEYYGMPVDETIALLAITKTSRGWRSPAPSDGSRGQLLSETNHPGQSPEEAMWAQAPEEPSTHERTGRDAIREAAAKVRASSPLRPEAAGASRGRSTDIRNIEDIIMAAELTVQVLERTAPEAPLSVTQRRRLAQRVEGLSERLRRAFDLR